MRKRILLSTAATLSLSCAVAAAQEEAGTGAGGVDVIVVSAQKRAESVQDVPLSVTAIPGERLEIAQLDDLSEIAGYTSGVYWENINISKPQIYIRGFGTSSFDAGTDPSVAVFVDDMYLSRFSSLSMELMDIDRVEVLKGPQGTLFGRNAAGGVISVHTKRPSDEFEGKAEVGASNYGTFSGRATVSGPVIPGAVNGRLSFSSRNGDGYVDIAGTPEDGFDTNRQAIRGQLDFLLSDSAHFLVTADAGRVREGMWSMENSGPARAQIFPPFIGANQPTPGRFDEAYDFNGYQHTDTWGVSGRLEVDMPFGQLVSISAFRKSDLDELTDFDATSADAIIRQFAEEADSFQQEIRLSGGDELEWLVGGYFFYEEVEREGEFFLGSENLFANLFNMGGAFSTRDVRTIETMSYAAFGQVSYEFAPGLSLTLGGRYSYDDKSMDRSAMTVGADDSVNPFSETFDVMVEDDFDSFDYAVILDWAPNDNTLLYASYKTGYKSGGFQTDPVLNADAARITFQPESVDSIEAGIKSQWFNNSLIVNAAIFYNDYENLQFLATVPLPNGSFSSLLANVTGADAYGGEVEMQAAIGESIDLFAGYSYLNSTYDDGFSAANGTDLSGEQTTRAPKHTFFVDISHTIPEFLGGSVTSRVGVKYTSAFPLEATGSRPFNIEEGYTLVDGSINYRPGDGAWTISLWAKNIADKEYRQHNITIPTPGGVVSLDTWARPRTYGVDVSFDF